MKEQIAEFVRTRSYSPLTAAQLADALGVEQGQFSQFVAYLDELEQEGRVVLTRTQRYGAPERMNLAVGRLQGHPRGFAFLLPDYGEQDIFVGKEALGGAMHGDRVVVRLGPPTRGQRPEGEVIRILGRAQRRVVGLFDAAKLAGYVTPDDPRLPDDIFIPQGATQGAKAGEKVVVEIIQYPEARRVAEGRIVERLGKKGDVGVDILSIIRAYDLPEAFPARVEREAQGLPDQISEAELAQRVDLRGLPMVTIDGEDAKDLDDAISLEMKEGRYLLGVHIADVSYYVKEGGTIDREAQARGTSVYLADRVVPMLPTRLSNDLCSLNAGEDRLALSCLMEIDRGGRVVDYRLEQSVIRVSERLSYNQVAAMVLENDQALRRRYRPLVPMLEQMLELRRILAKRRSDRGSIDFDLPEAKLTLNEAGFPVEIQLHQRTEADQMIEEFMLLANETVAEHFARLDWPFVYRVHEEPALDKLAALSDFLGLFGITFRPGEQLKPKQFQRILSQVAGKNEEQLINGVLLRSMKQAKYMAENLGHFGLAAQYYTHFTAPIRRYPDLIVHRVLREFLTVGRLTGRRRGRWQSSFADLAQHASERERLAVEAERETVDLKKAEFMLDKVGQRFEGLISGVTQFGFFVALPNTVEGLVHVSTLVDDYYHYNEKLWALMGERTRRSFRLGDPVEVKVAAVDLDARKIDFVLSEVAERPAPKAAPVRADRQPRGRRRAVKGRQAEVKAAPAEEGATKVNRRGRQAAPQAAPQATPEQRPAAKVNRRGRQAETGSRKGQALDMWGVPVSNNRPKEAPAGPNTYAITLADRPRKRIALRDRVEASRPEVAKPEASESQVPKKPTRRPKGRRPQMRRRRTPADQEQSS